MEPTSRLVILGEGPIRVRRDRDLTRKKPSRNDLLFYMKDYLENGNSGPKLGSKSSVGKYHVGDPLSDNNYIDNRYPDRFNYYYYYW